MSGSTITILDGLATGLDDGSFLEALKSDAPTRVMIEFSQPNTHKVFHVGHVRNVCVGDTLQRVLRARGHDVVAANYYGDFGIDVARERKLAGFGGVSGSFPPSAAAHRTCWFRA